MKHAFGKLFTRQGGKQAMAADALLLSTNALAKQLAVTLATKNSMAISKRFDEMVDEDDNWDTIHYLSDSFAISRKILEVLK